MKLCIPVRVPNGLESCVEPHLPHAEHLLVFDTGTREIQHIALREHLDGADGTGEAPRFDVVLCASFDKATRETLAGLKIAAFGTQAGTAAEAIAEFESLNPALCDGHGGCGGCGRPGGDGRHAGCACGGKGQKGHGHDHPHGHAHRDEAFLRKIRADALRIAVSSQDRRTITGHAGRCRRFWVYEIRGSKIADKKLRELSPEQTLHSSEPEKAHPLDDVHVMITAEMTPYLYQRLQRGGIRPFVTGESDPDEAVRALLEKVTRP